MLCPKCGTENSEGTKFCASCGANLLAEPAPSEPVSAPASEPVATAVAEPAAESAPKENKVLDVLKGLWAKCAPVWEKVKSFALANKLIVAGAAGGVALFILVCIIIGIANSGNGYIAYKDFVTMSSEDDGVVVIRNDKLIHSDVEADWVSSTKQSLDGTITAFTTNNGTLHVFNGKKVVNVAEDVVSFRLSVNGTGLAYISEDGNDYVLNLYAIGSGKNSVITELTTACDYDLSPDGKGVCYSEYNEDDDSNTLRYATASKNTKITSSDVELVGLSNGGKYIYVVGSNDNGDEILYTYNTKGEREKLGTVSSSYFYFNNDHTQILFYNDGRSYVSVKGGEAVKISSSQIRLLVAPNSNSFDNTYPVKSLFDHVYTGYDSNNNLSAWYIRKNTEKSCKLVSNIGNAQLDMSAEYLYYLYNSELRVIRISNGDSASEKYVALAEDVSRYVVTSNRSKVYYLSDGSLYSCSGKNGSGKKTVANDDVESFVINKKDVVFYSIDGDVYATNNGAKGKKVASDIEALIAAPNGYVYAAGGDTIYVSNGAKKLVKLYEKD